MFRLLAIFVALFAVSTMGFLSSRIPARASSKIFSDCDQYKRDKNNRCPGDTGYVSFVKEDGVPKDFAAYAAEQKAKKAAAAAAAAKK